MPFPEHDLATPSVDLGEGAVLVRADPAAWVRAWTVYRGIDEDFSQGFEARSEDVAGIPVAHWLELDGKPAAGFALLPGGIGDTFLIPPFGDAGRVVAAVLPLLRDWSDGLIRAQGIGEDFFDALVDGGFEPEETRRWMIRPVVPGEVHWDTTTVASVRPGDAEEIAALLHRSFSGLPTRDGQRDLDGFAGAVDRFFAQRGGSVIPDDASALVRRPGGTPVAVCLVNEHHGLPTIQFLATAPDARGRGLATSLINRAMAELVGVGDWVKLAVTVGTPAEALYERLGFKAGPPVSSLVLE